jgi:hypothetical protein
VGYPSRHPMARATLILGILALAGCPGDDPPPGDVEVAVGTGTTAFEPLAEGDPLEVVAGIQGGHHFHVHARMRGLDPGDPTMNGQLSNPQTRFSAFTAAGEQLDLMFPPYRLGYVALGDGSFELPSGRLLVLDDEQVPGLAGQEVRLAVEIIDDSGRRGSAEVNVVAVEGEPPEDFDAGVDGP